MSFRFVHAAHLHLDAPMRGIADAPASIRVALRDASLVAWERLVRSAIEHEAAFLLIAGGLFDSDGATARAHAAFAEGVRKLYAAGISTFVCLGEEDTSQGLLGLAPAGLSGLAPAATVFQVGRVSAVPVVRDGAVLATIHGVSSTSDGPEVSPATCFRVRGQGLQVALAAVPVERDAILDPAIDYWAVGRSHEQARHREQPWVVSSGTLQGRAPESSESGPKGAMVIEADDQHVRRVSFLELDRVRFLLLRVDVSGLPDPSAVRTEVLRQLDAEGAADDGRLLVVDATLHGEDSTGGAPTPWKRAAGLLDELRCDAEERGHPVWWNRVNDRRTRARNDPRPRTGKLGNVVSERAQALAAATLPRSSFLARRFDPLRQVWNAEIDLSSATELVREAASLAVDVLGSEAVDENSRLVNSEKRSVT